MTMSPRSSLIPSFVAIFNKRQQVKKTYLLHPRIYANQQQNGETDVEFENASNNGASSLRQEIIPKNEVVNGMLYMQVIENGILEYN